MFKQRNYDPETRRFRRHGDGSEEQDTVEKAVEGLALKIIAEDDERRAQELVCCALVIGCDFIEFLCLGPVQHRPKKAQLGSQKRHREKTGKAGTENSRMCPCTHSYVCLFFFGCSY